MVRLFLPAWAPAAFVGQICVYIGRINDIAAGTKAAITPMDWAGLVLICFVLPSVLSWIICEILRKIGWIKEGDLKLEYTNTGREATTVLAVASCAIYAARSRRRSPSL